MAELTYEKLNQLLASAKANRLEVIKDIQQKQAQAAELVHNYDGAISTLELLIDDLQAQDISAMSLDEFKKLMPEGVTVEGITLKDE